MPVIIFDKGDTRARDKRVLQIVLAERGTGFTLWRDVIDNLTDYKPIASTFHTMYLSSDHRQMAGLSFDSSEAASNFLNQIELITADPLNIALSAPKRDKLVKKMRHKVKESPSKVSRPKKSDISSPCLFQHVTSVDMSDFDRLFSMASMMNTDRHLDPNSVPPPSGHRRPLDRTSSSMAYSAINLNLSGHHGLVSCAPSPVASVSAGSETNSSNASV